MRSSTIAMIGMAAVIAFTCPAAADPQGNRSAGADRKGAGSGRQAIEADKNGDYQRLSPHVRKYYEAARSESHWKGRGRTSRSDPEARPHLGIPAPTAAPDGPQP